MKEQQGKKDEDLAQFHDASNLFVDQYSKGDVEEDHIAGGNDKIKFGYNNINKTVGKNKKLLDDHPTEEEKIPVNSLKT